MELAIALASRRRTARRAFAKVREVSRGGRGGGDGTENDGNKEFSPPKMCLMPNVCMIMCPNLGDL